MSSDDRPDDKSDNRFDNSDEFDDIVRGLDLNLSFPNYNDGDDTDIDEELDNDAEDIPEEPELREPADDSEQMLPGDDLSYRNPAPPPARPWRSGRVMAVTGVVAGPALLMLATLSGIVLPRAIAYGLALIFVACAVWLIAQLPERGPGRPDSPDDGAEL